VIIPKKYLQKKNFIYLFQTKKVKLLDIVVKFMTIRARTGGTPVLPGKVLPGKVLPGKVLPGKVLPGKVDNSANSRSGVPPDMKKSLNSGINLWLFSQFTVEIGRRATFLLVIF